METRPVQHTAAHAQTFVWQVHGWSDHVGPRLYNIVMKIECPHLLSKASTQGSTSVAVIQTRAHTHTHRENPRYVGVSPVPLDSAGGGCRRGSGPLVHAIFQSLNSKFPVWTFFCCKPDTVRFPFTSDLICLGVEILGGCPAI